MPRATNPARCRHNSLVCVVHPPYTHVRLQLPYVPLIHHTIQSPTGHRTAKVDRVSMSGLAAHLEQESPTAVHATLCALVRTNATASSAWADYLLDPETAAFFRARLPDAKADAAALVNSDTNPPSKKRKCDAGPPCSSTEPVWSYANTVVALCRRSRSAWPAWMAPRMT